jgi:hypothetical protein
MIWLLHPSHRKFIKILYKKVGHNGYIALTNDDWNIFVNLWQKNNYNSEKIHQGAYKIFINAANRRREEINHAEVYIYINVKQIESKLRRTELRNLFRVSVNTLLYFVIKFLIRHIRKKHTKR